MQLFSEMLYPVHYFFVDFYLGFSRPFSRSAEQVDILCPRLIKRLHYLADILSVMTFGLDGKIIWTKWKGCFAEKEIPLHRKITNRLKQRQL